MLASVIITNHNYGRFLRECIESVLAQTHSNMEAIVVDDGSTDDSRTVLKEYAGRLAIHTQDNGGQGSATNAGFMQATGNIVLFLDADDVLKPRALEAVVAAWRPGDVKMQFRLESVDEQGRALGPALPRLLHQGNVRPTASRFARWAFSFSSGSAYAVEALRKLLPLDALRWPNAVDYYLSCGCAFLGTIRNLPEPMGYYRLHRAREAMEDYLGGNTDASGLDQFLRKARQWELLGNSLKESGYVPKDARFDVPPNLAEIHLIVSKTASGYDAGRWGSVASATRQALSAFSTWPGIRPFARLALLAWIIAVAVSPGSLARRLYAWKQQSWTMPRLLQRGAGMLFGDGGKGVP